MLIMENTDITLQNFFIFNSLYGKNEGEEQKKLLYYYPLVDHVDKQIKNVGLVEGIIHFSETFRSNNLVSSLHTAKTRQLYFSPEANFWIAMTLNLPTISKVKEGVKTVEAVEEDVQDNVYEAALQMAYKMFRLFSGTFESTIAKLGLPELKTKLETFFNAYLKNMKIHNYDILTIFSGIQYLPLNTSTFLKVQTFINTLECEHNEISYSVVLYNDHLIWSGLEPIDMQIMYKYLIESLLPANMESELQGGSMPRNQASPFASSHQGRFIVGPSNLKSAKTIGKIPSIYLYDQNNEETIYRLLVYRTLSATVCLFLKGDVNITLEFCKALDHKMGAKLSLIVTDVAEYCANQNVSSNQSDLAPRFIYFNNLNLAYKSTVHLDNKQTGNISCAKESLKVMADIKATTESSKYFGETIIKTMNDYWIVGKVSNEREFFIAVQQKNLDLMKVHEEVKKVCNTELKGIFFHSL